MTRTDVFHGVHPGVLPVLPGDAPAPDKLPSNNAATGASAASVRALTSQAIAFYFRAPVKAFFRTRVDYLAYARSIQEQQSALQQALLSQMHAAQSLSSLPASRTHVANAWLWLKLRVRSTTPGVLASAVRHYGWRVVPDQVLPPLIANIGVGAVLYTSYLQILGRLHEDSGRASRRVYPPPTPVETFAAGFLAGSIQSVVAAPLDAVQARYDLGSSAAGMTGSGTPIATNGNGNGTATSAYQRPKSIWAFSHEKLREIGMRGIFAGWGLSFLKDSLGCAVFFSAFEYVKAQGYYRFVEWFYGSLNEDTIILLAKKRPANVPAPRDEDESARMPVIIRPHYAIEPAFLMFAGISASIAQQVIIHPLSHLQVEHWERLEMLDEKARRIKESKADISTYSRRWRMFRAYYHAYQESWAKCTAEAEASGLSMRSWLFRGFWWNTIRQVPSTSAGLIIFELVRRKYGLGGDQVKISGDGYEILLN